MTQHDSQITPAQAQAAIQPSPEEVWWADAAADEPEGYDLLKDAALYDLVGVPFMITTATFRDGIQRKGMTWRDDYVSLEITVAPAPVIGKTVKRIEQRRKKYELSLADMAAPGEGLVINDGSTGIYRQIVQYLAAKQLIILPEGDEDGEKGDSILDLPRSQWLSGAEQATDGFEIKLRCTRGLRFSEYTSEFLPPGEVARTWYIA